MNYALVVHSEFSSGKKTETKNTVIFSYQNGIINFQSRNPNYICAVHQDKSQSVTQLSYFYKQVCSSLLQKHP